MAVPTLTAVTPTTGLTKGGSLVRLTGTNFRLPPAPPPLGYVGGPAPRTVRVQFGGLDAAAAALSPTLIACWPAPWAGDYAALPAPLDVRVANLDDAGVEIPGEAATLPAAYRVQLPSLAEEGSLQRAIRAVLLALRRGVLPNTHHWMSRDYDGALGTPDRTVATLPAILLLGPTIPLNRQDARLLLPEAADPADAPQGWRRTAPPLCVDLAFDVRVRGAGAQQALSLAQALVLLLRDRPVLTVDGQDCPFVLPLTGALQGVPTPNGADEYEIRLPLELRGVQITEEPAMLQVVALGRALTANDGVPLVGIQSL